MLKRGSKGDLDAVDASGAVRGSGFGDDPTQRRRLPSLTDMQWIDQFPWEGVYCKWGEGGRGVPPKRPASSISLEVCKKTA